jgi:uncharacterized protein (DUF2147 family)
MKYIQHTLLLFILSLVSFAGMSFMVHADDSDLVIGIWEPTDGRARIKIEKIGSKYYGRIIWLKEPNDPATQKPKLDRNNPDTSMRRAPIKGLRILKDFSYKGKKEWSGGTIYDPKNGKTYSCVINMKKDNEIDIRGYVGVKALGRTDTWKKYTEK